MNLTIASGNLAFLNGTLNVNAPDSTLTYSPSDLTKAGTVSGISVSGSGSTIQVSWTFTLNSGPAYTFSGSGNASSGFSGTVSGPLLTGETDQWQARAGTGEDTGEAEEKKDPYSVSAS
ncbi:MAG TPA: hypothetical protein VNQ79_03345 [Blastocatellia bacterium]|nr:hypothetical protein [Blastocatellia bacterium]